MLQTHIRNTYRDESWLFRIRNTSNIHTFLITDFIYEFNLDNIPVFHLYHIIYYVLSKENFI